MPIIPATRVSTPTVGGFITICKGYNLFTTGGAIDLAVEWNHALIDWDPNLGLYKFRVQVAAGVYAGICGPAYASDIVLEGQSDGSTITLDASQSEILAGFEAGFGLRFIVLLDIWRLVVDAHWVSDGWNSHLEIDTHWESEGRKGFDSTLDLMMLIVRWLLTRGDNPIVTPARFPTGASMAMISSDITGLATTGHARVEPQFFTLINVFDKFAHGKEIFDALAKLGVTVMAGPTIRLSVPTTVDIHKVATDGVTYNVTTTASVMSGSAGGASTAGATELRVVQTHSSSIALSFGLGIEFSALKIFSRAYYTPDIDMLGLLGLTPTFGPFDNTVAANYGAAAPPLGARRPTGCCYQVLLEEPELAAAV